MDQAEQALLESLSVLRAAKQKQGVLQEDAARWRHLYEQEMEARRAAEQAKHAVDQSKQALESELLTLRASLQSLMARAACSKSQHSYLRPSSSLARARTTKFGAGVDDDSVRGGLLPLLPRTSAIEPLQLSQPLLSGLAAAAAGIAPPAGAVEAVAPAGEAGATASPQQPGLRRARTMSIGGLISMLVTANLLQADSVSPRMLSRAGQEASSNAAYWATHPSPQLLHAGHADSAGSANGTTGSWDDQRQQLYDDSAAAKASSSGVPASQLLSAGTCTAHFNSVDGSDVVSAASAALPALGPGCTPAIDRSALTRGSESGTSSTARRTAAYPDATPPIIADPYASLSSVSLVDDDGTSGVGLAAAAAVAAAAARAWATAASEQQRHHHNKRMSASAGMLAGLPAGSTGGGSTVADDVVGGMGATGTQRVPSQSSMHHGRRTGRAGYKLVASVYREPAPLTARQLPAHMRMHAASTANIQSLAGQHGSGMQSKLNASDNALPTLTGAPSDPGFATVTGRAHSGESNAGIGQPPTRMSTSSSTDISQYVDRSNSFTVSAGSSPVDSRLDAAGSPGDSRWHFQQAQPGTHSHTAEDTHACGADGQAEASNGVGVGHRGPVRGKSNLGRAAITSAAAEPAGIEQQQQAWPQEQHPPAGTAEAGSTTDTAGTTPTKPVQSANGAQRSPNTSEEQSEEITGRPSKRPSRSGLTLAIPDGGSGRSDFMGHSTAAGTLLVTSSGRMVHGVTPGKAMPASPAPPQTPHMLPLQESVPGLQGAFTVQEPTTTPGCHIRSSGIGSAFGHAVPCVVQDAARRTHTHVTMPLGSHTASLPATRRTASLDMSARSSHQHHPASVLGLPASPKPRRSLGATVDAAEVTDATAGGGMSEETFQQVGRLPPRPSWLASAPQLPSPRNHTPFADPQPISPVQQLQQQLPQQQPTTIPENGADQPQHVEQSADAQKSQQQNGTLERSGSRRYDEMHSITRRGSSIEPSRGGSEDVEGQCEVCTSSRALGKSTALTLHWLSPPRTALVVCKLSQAVYPLFNKVLRWLRSHQLSVYVEPAGYAHLEPDLLPPHITAQAQHAASSGTSTEAGHAGLPNGIGPNSHALTSLGSDLEAAGSGVLTWPEGRCPQNSIPDEVAQDLDFVVVLGGDGTLLWTCHVFGNRAVPPLVPFNMGSLGFLTPFPPDHIESMLAQTLKGGFPMILRHRLHATIVRVPQEGKAAEGDVCWADGHCASEKVVLNEVVVDRGISPFLTNLECYCDGNFITHVQGDGLIVSTPTGSTAYSLAAGGSMVHPQVPGILFTPVCPHSLSFRPLVFPDHVQLCIQVPMGARSQMYCSFDGKDRQELNAGDAIIIRMSQWPIPTVCSFDPSRDWFTGIREGLHWNERRVQGGSGH